MNRIVTILCLLFLFSCEDNSYDYGLDRYYEEIVTALGNQAFQQDSGERLYNMNSSLASSYKEGDRVYLNYTLLDDATPGYDRTVRANRSFAVSTGKISRSDRETIASTHVDSILFESMWIGSHYVNLQFYMDYHSQPHTISMLADSLSVAAGLPQLYFIHNNGDDPPGSRRQVILSFDLKELLGDPEANTPLSIHVVSSNYGDKQYNFIY